MLLLLPFPLLFSLLDEIELANDDANAVCCKFTDSFFPIDVIEHDDELDDDDDDDNDDDKPFFGLWISSNFLFLFIFLLLSRKLCSSNELSRVACALIFSPVLSAAI